MMKQSSDSRHWFIFIHPHIYTHTHTHFYYECHNEKENLTNKEWNLNMKKKKTTKNLHKINDCKSTHNPTTRSIQNEKNISRNEYSMSTMEKKCTKKPSSDKKTLQKDHSTTHSFVFFFFHSFFIIINVYLVNAAQVTVKA